MKIKIPEALRKELSRAGKKGYKARVEKALEKQKVVGVRKFAGVRKN